MKTELYVDDLELEIEFDFYPEVPATHLDPPDGGYVDITDVLHKGESIYDLLDYKYVEKWEREIYEQEEEDSRTPPED
tara:strand:+ start:553 stop:786 length:234 start_codon:yes stop_codon:yes gene_type:complete